MAWQVLDGVAGVQAQTLTVWRQARKYRVPTVAFVNKMDRDGANLANVVASIRTKLDCVPLVLHGIAGGVGMEFDGVLDFIELERFVILAFCAIPGACTLPIPVI